MWKLLAFKVCLGGIFAEILVPRREISAGMEEYIATTNFTKSFGPVGVIGNCDGYSDPLLDYMLKTKTTSPFLVSTSPEWLVTHKLALKTLVYFLKSSEDLATSACSIKSALPNFIYFVLIENASNNTWLSPTLEVLWSCKLLNYLIVLSMENKVHVFGYNPFTKAVLNLTNKMFPDLSGNLQGYQWKIGVATQVVIQKDYLNSDEIPTDLRCIKEIAQRLNATTNFVKVNFTVEIIEQLKDQTLDLSIHRTLQLIGNKNIFQPSYPLALEYLVIMVPTAKLMPRYTYLLSCLESTVWMCIALSIILEVCVIYTFTKLTKFPFDSFGEVACKTARIFLNTSYNHMDKVGPALGIVVLTWSYYSMLVAIAFNTSLRGSLMKNKYEKQIATIEDIRSTGLDVYFNLKKYSNVMGDFQDISGQLRNAHPNYFLFTQALNSEGDAGFVVPDEVALGILQARIRNSKPIYKILSSRYVGAFRVFNFVQGFPFVGRFDRMIALFDEFGLSQFGVNRAKERSDSSFTQVPMSVDHLQGVFELLLIGLFLSLVGFLGELIFDRYGEEVRGFFWGSKIRGCKRHGQSNFQKNLTEISLE